MRYPISSLLHGRALGTILAILSSALLLPCVAAAQYSQEWLRTSSGFWGVGVDFDSAGNILATGAGPDLPSNGYRHDIRVLKYGSDGGLLWMREYNNDDDATNQDDDPSWLVVDSQDDVLVVGSTHTNDTGDEAVVLKYDGEGNLLWERLFGGSGVTADYGFFLALDADDNVYAAGRSFGENWDFITVKLNPAGELQWQRTKSFGASDEPDALAVDGAGRVMVTGQNSNQRGVTVVYDTDGNELWSAILDEDDPGPIYSPGHAVFDGEGNALVCGLKTGGVFLAKYSPSGELLFEKNYAGGTLNRMRVDSQDNVIMTGESATYDLHLLKVDPAGEILWSEVVDTGGEGVGIDLAIAPDDGIVLAATSSFVLWHLLHYDANGTQLGMLTINPGGLTNYPHRLALGSSGEAAVTGSGPIATALFSPPPPVTTAPGDPAAAAGIHLDPVNPNPFNPKTRVRFELAKAGNVDLGVYGVDGRRLATLTRGSRAAGSHEIYWDGRDDAGRPLGSGVYLLRLRAGTETRTGRAVLVR